MENKDKRTRTATAGRAACRPKPTMRDRARAVTTRADLQAQLAEALVT